MSSSFSDLDLRVQHFLSKRKRLERWVPNEGEIPFSQLSIAHRDVVRGVELRHGGGAAASKFIGQLCKVEVAGEWVSATPIADRAASPVGQSNGHALKQKSLIRALAESSEESSGGALYISLKSFKQVIRAQVQDLRLQRDAMTVWERAMERVDRNDEGNLKLEPLLDLLTDDTIAQVLRENDRPQSPSEELRGEGVRKKMMAGERRRATGWRREKVEKQQHLVAERGLVRSLTLSQLVDEDLNAKGKDDEPSTSPNKNRRASTFRMTGEWAERQRGKVWLPRLSRAETRDEMMEMMSKWDVEHDIGEVEDATLKTARDEWQQVRSDMMEAWERREMLTEKLQEHLERMRMNKQANEEMKEQVEGARCQLEYFHRLRDKLTDEEVTWRNKIDELEREVQEETRQLEVEEDEKFDDADMKHLIEAVEAKKQETNMSMMEQLASTRKKNMKEDEVSIVKFSSNNDFKISNVIADVVDKHHRSQESNPSRAEEAIYLQAVLTRNFKVLYQIFHFYSKHKHMKRIIDDDIVSTAQLLDMARECGFTSGGGGLDDKKIREHVFAPQPEVVERALEEEESWLELPSRETSMWDHCESA
ncbi:hypothetical protein GUITHDRAFT_141003 [Guillardia theta CCMP2712]|uniref:Uncharacterized protein n=1 Tax=Guillardia theta (strain CCMP2712) TaxID=905079 RepID=L1J2Z7_GUITC|nr:hypothetical protein GUITHDRAFT_141003 [Guillardia theta CCMP2712]EKX42876.1 hypothetical protein GUITHDRAFT_141003 [Guillardia theta CCMP2712]|eukprot:XP_005829856.1 hypothetical protein GUITHDRAFT_141003 [Guillardia theta CCMP2712]